MNEDDRRALDLITEVQYHALGRTVTVGMGDLLVALQIVRAYLDISTPNMPPEVASRFLDTYARLVDLANLYLQP